MDNVNKPEWWKVIRIITLLPFPIFPLFWMTSLMLFDQPDHYWSKMFLVVFLDTYPFYILLLNRLSLWLFYRYAKITLSLLVYLIPFAILLSGIVWYRIGPMPSSELDKRDVRNYWFTPAFDLADAIKDNDISEIRNNCINNPGIAEYKNVYHGESMLFFAFDNDKYDAVKVLVECGSNPNELGNNGQAILHILCMREESNSSLSLLNWLLEHGADPNIMTDGSPMYKYGPKVYMNPLQALCYYGSDCQETVRALLAHGAKFRNKQEEEESIETAQIRELNQVVRILQEENH